VCILRCGGAGGLFAWGANSRGDALLSSATSQNHRNSAAPPSLLHPLTSNRATLEQAHIGSACDRGTSPYLPKAIATEEIARLASPVEVAELRSFERKHGANRHNKGQIDPAEARILYSIAHCYC
jgi:hypothetical protein